MAKFKKRNAEEDTKVDVFLTSSILDKLIYSFFSNNSNIKVTFFRKIRELLTYADTSMFTNDLDMMLKIECLENLTEQRLDNMVTSSEALFNSCFGGDYDVEIENILGDILSGNELSDADLTFYDEYMSSRIKNIHLFRYLPQIEELSQQLKSGVIGSIAELNTKTFDVLEELKKETELAETSSMKSARAFVGETQNTMSNSMIDNVVTSIKKGKFVQTGIQALNLLLNKGFENGRLYTLVATPKTGKSATLIDLALHAKKYNGNYKPKDPTKKGAVLYITQENQIGETLERVWSHYFGVKEANRMNKFSTEQVIQKLSEVNFLNNDDSEELSIIIAHREFQEITPYQIEDVIREEVNEKGYECVAVFHDYLKRLRPSKPTGDMRIDLGNITEELSVLSDRLQIPIVTATQMNRKGSDIVKNFPARAHEMLNSTHVADSNLIVENSDVIILLNYVETFINGKKQGYMMFKLSEPRYHVPEEAEWTIFHPLENRIRLTQDLGYAEGASEIELEISSSPIDIKSTGQSPKKMREDTGVKIDLTQTNSGGETLAAGNRKPRNIDILDAIDEEEMNEDPLGIIDEL